MEAIQFIQYTPEQLEKKINDGVKIQLQDFLNHLKYQEPKEYLSRSEVAKMLDVDLSTIHNWCKKKKLNPLGIGSRVYFLRSEIEASLKPLNL